MLRYDDSNISSSNTQTHPSETKFIQNLPCWGSEFYYLGNFLGVEQFKKIWTAKIEESFGLDCSVIWKQDVVQNTNALDFYNRACSTYDSCVIETMNQWQNTCVAMWESAILDASLPNTPSVSLSNAKTARFPRL